VGIVGIIDDVTKAVPSDFANAGDVLLLVENGSAGGDSALQEFGSSEYAKVVLNELWGTPPTSHTRFLEPLAELNKLLAQAAQQGLLTAARDLSDSVAVELVEGCFANGLGVDVELIGSPETHPVHRLFGEHADRVLLACRPENVTRVEQLFSGGLAPSGKVSIPSARKIGVVTDGAIRITAPLYSLVESTDNRFAKTGEAAKIEAHVSALKAAWSGALEAQIAEELVTA
jgi:phosphoribosylformylglycinamidine synthase